MLSFIGHGFICAGTIACSVMGSQEVDFTREVRPILSKHCFACHGPDEAARKASLSLVSRVTATSTLESGSTPIVPGHPGQSELWLRINDENDPMPPIEEQDPLTPDERDIIRRWIEQGASYEPHWAYVTPVEKALPVVTDHDWSSNPIDRHLLARFEQEGFGPSPETDPATYYRRLCLDLTGLPPTIEQLDAWLDDDSADAHEAAIDRLLDSPHFGERMAIFWLDLVRYADTVGYHGDQEHNAWPYRDWVIRSFNQNIPFDTFTREQIAGDLLDEPGQDQLVASGYNRLLQTTHEGGLQLKEYRAIYMADRVRNVTSTWLGATLGCAQCHDHKYDPYTMEDFYAFGAFFADIDDEEHLSNPYGGLNTLPTRRAPEMRVHTQESIATEQDIQERIAGLDATIERATRSLESNRPEWEAQALRDHADGSPRERVWVDDHLDTGGEISGTWNFTQNPPVEPRSGSTYRIQEAPGLVQHYTLDTTRTPIIHEGDTLVAWILIPRDASTRAVMLQCNIAGNWNHRAVWGDDSITYGHRTEDWNGYRRMGALPEQGAWHRLEVPFAELGIPSGASINGIAFTQFGGPVYWDRTSIQSVAFLEKDLLAALQTPPADRTDAMRTAIAARQREDSSEIMQYQAQRRELQQQITRQREQLPLTLVTRSLEVPREVRILPRGDWLDESGELVQPAVPHFMGELPEGEQNTRLDLANWLVSRSTEGGVGELVARVFVNRIWALFFGNGLCPSLEDFGGQGVPPTHPELLDHLSIHFVDSGWDIKALVKSIVLSRAYRQTSMHDVDLAEHDPENLLHARQSRHRLPAEMIRDTMLSVSGLLLDKQGGRSVKPPQPEGYYRHLNFPKRKYHPDTGQEQWRRGVYVHWQRQFLHPMFRAFDGPTREECTARRQVSNTPTAALVLLNDPVSMSAAIGFANRILMLELPDDRARVALAMRMATARHPKEIEVNRLFEHLALARQAYHADEAATTQLLAGATFLPPGSNDSAELAAWSDLMRVILNLHETINRD